MVSLFALLALVPVFATAANITVTVGVDANGQPAKMILPNKIVAQPGDVVNFQFIKGNHTITQSPFSAPCTRQKNTVTGELGIDTSFQFVSSNSIVVPVLIDSTAPIWLFCGQATHCNDGMVAVINEPPAADKTFELFKAAAATAPIPGPGVTADFTPPAAGSGSASGSASGSGTPTGTGSASGTGTGSSTSSGPKPTNAAPVITIGKSAVFASSLLLVAGLFM